MHIIKYICFILFLLFRTLLLNCHLCLGADTIFANQSLSGDQTIVSAGEIFELGFFKPGNRSKYYIGIWYKKVSTQTVVWVANREKPVSSTYSSELKILHGNLVLLNESKIPVWSTNVSSTTSNSHVVAVLGDNGNLILEDRSNNLTQRTPLWQSFGHPVQAWLPGVKIAYNNLTKTKQVLTSWKSLEDPAPGLFSLELDPAGSQYVIKWNGSITYWTSGPWDERARIFRSVPEMSGHYIYKFTYVSNINESYFTYSSYTNKIITRLIMDVSGQIQQLTWLEPSKAWILSFSQPRKECEVYAFCGAFGTCNEKAMPFCNCLTGFRPRSYSEWNLSDYSGGCVRKTSLQCDTANYTSKVDSFLPNSHMRLPDHSQSVVVGTAAQCESACLNNCSCTAYAYDSSGCSIWNGELLNLQLLSEGDANGRTIYIRLAASELPRAKGNNGIVIGAIAGSVSVLLVLLGLGFILIMIRRRHSFIGIGHTVEGSLVVFGYKDLQTVTKNFSEKLGGGGFGSVFKGTFPDSTVIAVKRLESVSQGEKQFRTEVSTIGSIQHVNLVRLRGFCSEGNKKLLVYDYMPNGSLDSHLFHVKDSKVLEWKARHQIALGTARGLAYLHGQCRDCIIHCDIKPENILLDAEFCPKVSDFGLAKLFGRDFSRVLTTMRGTRGYLAPEWISGVAITSKADVYSYGMMLFEIISGKRNSEQNEDGNVNFFPALAARITKEAGDILSLLDKKLDRAAGAEEVTRLCRVACWCVQDDENHRPSMGQVVQILEGVVEVGLSPIPRAFQLMVESQRQILFYTELSSNQCSQGKSKPSNGSEYKSTTSSASSQSDSDESSVR